MTTAIFDKLLFHDQEKFLFVFGNKIDAEISLNKDIPSLITINPIPDADTWAEFLNIYQQYDFQEQPLALTLAVTAPIFIENQSRQQKVKHSITFVPVLPFDVEDKQLDANSCHFIAEAFIFDFIIRKRVYKTPENTTRH